MSEFSFKLPDLGEGIVESEIVEWHVKLGDTVAEDQHIVDVMTDKAVVEVTAPVTGIVASLACNAGEVIAVGSELILFKSTDTKLTDGAATQHPVSVQSPLAQPDIESAITTPWLAENTAATSQHEPDTTGSMAQPAGPVGVDLNTKVDADAQLLTSPSVRYRARNEGINLHLVTGSGPAGRINNTDLDDFIAAGGMQVSLSSPINRQPTTATTEIKIRGLRRVIAQKMLAASQNIPHYSYIEEIDLSALEDLRQHLNDHRSSDQSKLTLLPFIMQALAKALPNFPHCNALYDDQAQLLTQYQPVHVGIATMTEQGLLVPVVKAVESLDIWQCAAQLSDVSEAARAGKANTEQLTGSTITITSLGAIGGIATTPIINAPETTIIGVNKMQQRAVVQNGQIVIRKMMNLSASFDHRIVDGYDGAQLIQTVKRLLENPGAIFV